MNKVDESRAIRREVLARLAERGVAPSQFSKTVRIEAVICDWMGWSTSADPLDTLRRYLREGMPKAPGEQPEPPERYIGQVAPGRLIMPKSRAEFRMPPALRVAAERAEFQPRLHSMVSRVSNPIRDR